MRLSCKSLMLRVQRTLPVALIVFFAAVTQCSTEPRIGIVTMSTSDIMSYANVTEMENRKYAERWGYGFHVVDHAVDLSRVPHWSKLHAVQLFLPEYDFVFWIDADAVFFDQTRRIEDVVAGDQRIDAPGNRLEMWAQDIWPDYPSIHRNEMIDTGMVLFRNSRWTRQFITEMYYYPSCQEFLNWTEQYCFTVAHRENLLGLRDRIAILPTPTLNHHILPPPNDPGGLFVLHLAGRPSKARSSHFEQVHAGRAEVFRSAPKEHSSFWRFRELFKQHGFGGIASLQACVFGIGPRHTAFLDALLFHFPYLGAFTIVRQGAPQLWSQMRAAEEVGERFPERMAHMDVTEYMMGITKDGEPFVQGFFCDIFVLGVESWRHLPSVDILGRLARSGLEPYHGEKNMGFGYSPLRDAFFVWLDDGCEGDSSDGTLKTAIASGRRLDGDDEDGSGLVAACDLLSQTRAFVEGTLLEHGAVVNDTSDDDKLLETTGRPALWSVKSPGEPGVTKLGDVALGRVGRADFAA